MIDKRPFQELGRFQNDWLNARYHFSFSHYHRADRQGWGKILVWNDDEIAPQSGFAPHPHRDMEIITYVRSGAITHEDNLGNRGRTGAGDVQVMSAGTGIRHAEYNRENEETQLFQIWIETAKPGATPGWSAARFPQAERDGALKTLASGYAEDQAAGALKINQDARVLGATLSAGAQAAYAPSPGRHQYVALARGSALVNGVRLDARDGAAIKDEADIRIEALDEAEVVLVDSP